MSVSGARAGIVDKRGAGAVAEKKYFRLRNTDSETQHFFQSLLDKKFLNVPYLFLKKILKIVLLFLHHFTMMMT